MPIKTTNLSYEEFKSLQINKINFYLKEVFLCKRF